MRPSPRVLPRFAAAALAAGLLASPSAFAEAPMTAHVTTDTRNPDAALSADERAVAQAIAGLFLDTDARRWDAVEAAFTPEVLVDCSDLGQEAGEVSRSELVSGWRGVLPGFERTVHHPHNLAVWVVGDRATATADALALHHLDGESWTVFVGYDMELVKQDGRWLIERTRLSLYDEVGDRGLTSVAARHADGSAPAAPSQSPNFAGVEAFFTALEGGDLDGFVNNFAPDGRQVMPLAPDIFPQELDGRDAIREQYAPVMQFESQRYPRELIATSDPSVVLVKYTGQITKEAGAEYNNSYLGEFRFDDQGRITEFTELFNPRILLADFPGVQPAHHSVHAAGAGPADGVRLQEVTFESGGDQLVGHLFLPPGFDASRKYPAVVVTGSWTSVKEQMPDAYASRLAKDGFVTLTFDFRGFGESAGEPRQFEDGERKIEDIQAAVGFLQAHENTTDDIAGLGVCASAGYMAHATGRDPRIRHLALVAPWMHNPEMTEKLYASRPGGRERLLEMGREAQAKYERTGEVDYDQATSEINQLAAMYVPEGAFSYYLSPAKGAGPVYANRWAVQSWVPWLTFDAISAAPGVTVPVHVVHSEQGAVPQGAKDFIEGLPSEPRTEWLNQFTQEQLYHQPDAVAAAMTSTAAWLHAQMN